MHASTFPKNVLRRIFGDRRTALGVVTLLVPRHHIHIHIQLKESRELQNLNKSRQVI
jgi:hypothetical protein